MKLPIYIVLYWENPFSPIIQKTALNLPHIVKYIQNKYDYKDICIITNSEECSFLLKDFYVKYDSSLTSYNTSTDFSQDIEYYALLWISIHNHCILDISELALPSLKKGDFYELNYQENSHHKKNNSKKIIIRADGGQNRGTGHLYRAATLTEIFLEKNYDIIICTLHNHEMNLGVSFFLEKKLPHWSINNEEEFYNYITQKKPDLLILDILNTSKEFIIPLKTQAKHIISFENLGSGTSLIDFTINDLYTNPLLPSHKQYSGIKYALLNQYFNNTLKTYQPQFNNKIQTILILFGGTDPSQLTQKTIQALITAHFMGHVIVIQNFQQNYLKYDNLPFQLTLLKKVQYMPQYIAMADLAISSAGRSILEFIAMSVPTLCLSQNNKELMHTHNIGHNGILHIGLGSLLTSDIIAQYILLLQNKPLLRKSLYQHAYKARKQFSNERIIKKILTLI